MDNSSYNQQAINACNSCIDSIKRDIDKNYKDMDLENSELNTQFEEIVDNMLRICDDLKNEIAVTGFPNPYTC